MQAHRKAVVCYAKPEEVLPLVKALQPEGLCISTNCLSEDAAKRLIDSVSRMFGCPQ